MKLSSFKQALASYPSDAVAFILPDGDPIPLHAHVTEFGRMEKSFLDCGGKFRRTGFASLQIWVADDLDHRLLAGKLAAIVNLAEPFLGDSDLEMQVECQVGSISLFTLESFASKDGILVFSLGLKRTACLAMEECLPAPTAKSESCCGPSGCC